MDSSKKIKLNLGCGNDIQEGYINHDIRKHRKEIDIAFDLNEENWLRLNWFDEEKLKLKFFVKGDKVEFEEIRAWDVLEHLKDPLNFFNNCWELLKKDGILDMKVCGWKNPNAHVDITHKRPGFDIKSFDYFDPTTELGRIYGYYTNKKWKIISKDCDRKTNVLIKLVPVK